MWFKEIPADVAGLTGLRDLDVSYNLIKTVDDCLLDRLVSHLRYLNVRENPFHCDPNCSLQARLRRAYFTLVKRFVVERRRAGAGHWSFQKDRGLRQLVTTPFIGGKCWTPVERRGESVIDWKCPSNGRAMLVSPTLDKCNHISSWHSQFFFCYFCTCSYYFFLFLSFLVFSSCCGSVV